jgi:hypothetical protein
MDPGLCSSCRWTRIVESAKGSRFYLCGRSRFDPRFARYPRIPVLRCTGHEPVDGGGLEPHHQKEEEEE